MIILFGVLFMLYVGVKPATNNYNPTIGESKVVDGVEYFNLGTLENEDNWIKVGSVVIQCYVNVYEKNGDFIVKIEEDTNEKVYNYIECYDFAEADRRFDLMTQPYVEKGVDDFHNN